MALSQSVDASAEVKEVEKRENETTMTNYGM
jgi:hypothetical protein